MEGCNVKKEIRVRFADKDLSSWTGPGRSGHVQIPTFHQISHVSVPRMTLRRDLIIILHGFASINLKNKVKHKKKKEKKENLLC